MKRLKSALGLEATIMRHPVKLQNIRIVPWKRTRPMCLGPQNAHRFSCTQTEVFNSFHNTACSAETARYNHLKAGTEEPSTAGAVMGSTVANNIIQPKNHAEMIKEYFDISRSTAYRIIEKDDRLKSCDVHILARNLNTLQENNVDTAEVRNHMALLCRCPLTMEHDIAVMKEVGLKNLTAEHFAGSKKFFKRSVALFKRWGMLPEHYDPVEALIPLGIPDEVLNNVNFFNDINNLTLEQLHWNMSRVYLSWHLDCSNEEVNKLHQTYSLTKKSMTLQQKVLDQLIHEWNISMSKIHQNAYLLKCSPVNIALIDSKVRNIAGIDVKEYASWTPRILTIPYHHLLRVSQILSTLPISAAAVKALPRICTLHPDTLSERINHLREDSEFSALQSHPRMLHLLFYHKKIISRLDLLQQVKKSNVVPSLNKVSGPRRVFSKYMKVGDLRQNKKDIITYLSQDFGVTPATIRKCLHLHCWGPQTTLTNVQRNLSVLKEVGFTIDQVMAGLDVVLYPPDVVQDQLNQLPQRPQVQPFSRFKSEVNVLQHLLYFIEKNTTKSSLASLG